MLVSGCSNSLLTKYQDNQCVANCDAAPSQRAYFEQPVFQTVQMFLAESGCWIVYYLTKWHARRQNGKQAAYESLPSADDSEFGAENPKLTGKNVLLLAIPACCDICGTTLMNLGLLFVPVSIFQMTRGAVVLFVAVFSIMFLNHRIRIYQWIGLTSVVAGVFVVGLSAALGAHDDTPADVVARTPWQVVCGILMILSGQVFTASQFALEEHILSRYSLSPTKVVAWEGTYGTIVSIVGSYAVLLIAGRGHSWSGMFDVSVGLGQVLDHRALVISSVAIMISLATFNFCGLSVTRSISATSRSTIDTSRTLGIWLVSLVIGWEKFRFMQLVGFGMLVYGTLLFNGILDHGKHLDEDDPVPHAHAVPHEP